MTTPEGCFYCKQIDYVKLRSSKFTFPHERWVCDGCFRHHELECKRLRHREVYADYYKENQDRIVAKVVKWNKENRDQYLRNKRVHNKNVYNDVVRKLRAELSSRLGSLVPMKGPKFIKFLGCSIDHFNLWLEFNMTADMTFDNHGEHWHIDHVIPCKFFDHSKPDEVAMCWHWSNLTPLRKGDNMSKSAKIYSDYIIQSKKRYQSFVNYYGEGSETRRVWAEQASA